LLQFVGLKRFLIVHQLVCRHYPPTDLVGPYIGEAGYEDDVDERIDFADALGGGDAVAARRHADIQKGDRERPAVANSLIDGGNCLLPPPTQAKLILNAVGERRCLPE
jgi:hypothetical protein